MTDFPILASQVQAILRDAASKVLAFDPDLARDLADIATDYAGSVSRQRRNEGVRMSDNTGLEDRYEVRRRNDPGGKHDACRYFVLDPEHDPIARLALWHYAEAAEATNLELARDLCAWLNDLEPDHG